MSLTTDERSTRPVHFPADPNKFSFDKEVSAIFEDMARRSIPNFEAAHEAHAEMVRSKLYHPCRVLDIGASRGSFLKALKKTGERHQIPLDALEYTAMDTSQEMCRFVSEDYPEARVVCGDITKAQDQEKVEGLYDIVCLHYVLQFIKPEDQIPALLKVFSLVKPGGFLVFGHKSSHVGYTGELAHDQYIEFRIRNGYTREEVEAKTRALKGSMFPRDHYVLLNTIRHHFTEMQETFRFMMFSTLIAIK